METKKIKMPKEVADKIYNEFRDLILSDLSTEELIKKCADHAVHIVYNSYDFDWEEYINEKGTTCMKMVDIKFDPEFWFQVKNQLIIK